MAPNRIPAIHPIARLGVTLAEIERRTGVKRPNLSKVVHGERDRVGLDSLLAIKREFPAFDFDAAASWKWAEHKRTKSARPASSEVRRGR